MKILLFIGSGNFVGMAAGAEKVMCQKSNEMVNRGHEVILICNDIKHGLPFYPLDNKVKFINLNGTNKKEVHAPWYFKLFREIFRPLRKYKLFERIPNPVVNLERKFYSEKINKIIEKEKPEVIVACFTCCMATINFCYDYKIPKILMVHNDPQYLNFDSYFTKKTLEKVDYIQVLIPEFVEYIKNIYKNKEVVVIPNSVPQFKENELAKLSLPKEKYKIINVARIDLQKNQELLVSSFSRLADKYPQWNIEIYGLSLNNEFKNNLLNLISEYKLDGRVFINDPVPDIFDKIRESEVFAFPSIYEGWGIALTEAMSLGLPAIGLKMCPSVNCLIEDGKNGFLADNSIDNFSQKMELLMQNKELRIKMGRDAHKSMKKFDPKFVWDKWEEVMKDAVLKNNTKLL